MFIKVFEMASILTCICDNVSLSKNVLNLYRLEGFYVLINERTAILTIGMFLSKVLGLIYIFPFYAIVGEENIGLYQYAYIPYTIMLSIAISGVPIAVSKFVSKYNAMGDYETGRSLLKSGMIIMICTGIVVVFIIVFY